MSKLFKNSKQIMAVVIAFAILAVSLFAGSIVVGAETADSHCEGRIEYWDGSRDTTLSGAGTQENPYKITNAAELNYVCAAASSQETENKYFEVDPTIRAFILQPQAIVTALGGDSVFMDISSAAETKELFEVTAAGKSLVSWIKSGDSSSTFAGCFNGNGVEIYGLYSDGGNSTSGHQASALFPKVDGNGADVGEGAAATKPTILKNFAVKNSYFKGYRRVGAVVGTSWWKSNSGTNCDGWVEISYCEVANNFLLGQNIPSDSGNSEMAVVCGGASEDPYIASYISVHGNVTEHRTNGVVDSTKNFNRIFSKNDVSEKNINGELHNSIVLDTTVSGLAKDNATIASNVYTNLASQIAGVTVLENDGYGAEGQAAMNKLDWVNTWFMSHNGPTFRALHGEMGTLVQDDKTHGYGCLDCGLVDANGYIGHSYECTDEANKIYVCSECDWDCKHTYWEEDNFEGDCVKAPGTYISCACGFYEEYPLAEAPGHTLEYVAADAGDCETEGNLAYWYCSVCDKNFAESDYATEELAKWAAMDTAVTDAQLNTGFGAHTKATDENGEIIMYDETGHWYICSINGGRLDHNSNALAEGKVVKHSFNRSVCMDCGYECKDHNWRSTGKAVVMGDCYTDHQVEYKCSTCGTTKAEVTKPKGHDIAFVAEVPATDKLEGTKAHYLCKTCESIFADAEGKTSLTKASLIIPKVFSAEQQAIIDANTNNTVINTDTSTKSPATGDSVMSVLAVAALSGAAFVIARKAMKA